MFCLHKNWYKDWQKEMNTRQLKEWKDENWTWIWIWCRLSLTFIRCSPQSPHLSLKLCDCGQFKQSTAEESNPGCMSPVHQFLFLLEKNLCRKHGGWSNSYKRLQYDALSPCMHLFICCTKGFLFFFYFFGLVRCTFSKLSKQSVHSRAKNARIIIQITFVDEIITVIQTITVML